MLKNNLSLGILDFGFQCQVDVLPKLGITMLSQLRQRFQLSRQRQSKTVHRSRINLKKKKHQGIIHPMLAQKCMLSCIVTCDTKCFDLTSVNGLCSFPCLGDCINDLIDFQAIFFPIILLLWDFNTLQSHVFLIFSPSRRLLQMLFFLPPYSSPLCPDTS